MVALFGQGRLFHRVVVVHEIGIPLVRFRSQEPVEALEAAPSGPLGLPRRHVHFVFGSEVPLPGHVRVPASLAEHLGDGPAFEGHMAALSREPGGGLGDGPHPIGGVISAGHQAGASRRAKGGGVEVGEGQAAVGDPLDVGCLDQAAERLHGRVADVIEHDVHNARGSFRSDRLDVRIPVLGGLGDVDVDHALERFGHRSSSGSLPANLHPKTRARTRPSMAPSVTGQGPFQELWRPPRPARGEAEGKRRRTKIYVSVM